MTSEATQALSDASGVSQTAAGELLTAGEELQSAARVQGLQAAAESLEGAAGSLGDVAESLRGVTVGLGIAIQSLIFASEDFGGAVAEGRVNVIGADGNPQRSFAPLAAEVFMPVEITNSDDIYDPARIAQLQGQGLNNREIGLLLRGEVPAATDMLLESTAPTALLETAPPMPEMIVDSVSITAGSVNVTGGTVTGAEMLRRAIRNNRQMAI